MRFFLRFLLVAVLLSVASRARAQTVNSTQATVPTPTNSPLFNQHPQNIPISSINFNDCQGDQGIHFVLLLSGASFTAYQLEVWAGSQDCTALTARTGANPTCWPVLSPLANPAQSTSLTVMARDIVSQITATTKQVTYTTEADVSVCNTAQTSSTGEKITLYFFLTDQSHNLVGSAWQYQVTVDTKGSPVQGNITSNIGDTLLTIAVPSTHDPDVKRWNVYCDPPNNNQVAPDAADYDGAGGTVVCDDASVDEASVDEASTGTGDDGGDASIEASVPTTPSCTTVPSNNSCPSKFLIPGGGTVSSDEAGTTVTGGTQVIVPGVFNCASADVTSTSIDVTGLVNGTVYTVAVAAVDSVGNVGPLSNVICNADSTPAPVADFWTQYQNASGCAGGGYCALEGVGVPAGSLVFGAGMLAAVAALVRRRKR